MPPRLAHRKSRAGCTRCKARKVKCDETTPKCGACVRHNLACVYPESGTPTSSAARSSKEARESEHALELRLMHEWMAHVCESFTVAWQFWRHQAPLIAFENRYLLDALLALSALHLARTGPKIWDPVAGQMVSPQEESTSPQSSNPAKSVDGEWKTLSKSKARTPSDGSTGSEGPSFQHHVDMLQVSRTYFDRALDGQRKAVTDLTADTIQAVYMCSILVTNYGLLNLSEESYGANIPSWDPIKWYRIAEGSRHIACRWYELAGDHWYRLAGNFYGHPDLSDSVELFHPRHREPFAYLLTDVDGDAVLDEDREAYEHTLSYVGLLYKGIVDRSDLPKASSRRVIALASRVPPHFAQLIYEQRPRALVILAHTFAAVKLLANELPWFKGIAERQVPILARSVPQSWVPMMDWPLRITEGAVPEVLKK